MFWVGQSGCSRAHWQAPNSPSTTVEDCGLVGAVYGAVAGGSALLPLGIHIANHGRGNFGLSLLSSLAIGGLGLALASETNSASVMIPVPVAQIVTSILIERKTAH